LLTLPLALALGLALTPIAIRLAWAVGYLDHPEARKLHTSATALLGGVSIFVAALAAAVVIGFGRPAEQSQDLPYLLGGALIALMLGLWDDRFGMHPILKLAGQGSAATVLLASGAVPDLHLGPATNALVTLVALVALMNAVNFLDNMNGMVAGFSAIALIAFAWGSLERGTAGLAAAQLALAGACLGFLPYNFPSARIFLGDAGSLLLGYSLGASAVLAFGGGPRGWGQLGPVLALAYPAFDMIFVVITRLRDGRKIYIGGRDHTNHRLASVLKCPKTAVMILWLGGAALSASGLVVQKLDRAMPALLLVSLWSALFLATGIRLSSVPIEASLPRPSKS
jgi:UDP-GlcNAc:undecaprenyl-phosphate/decaprenyl-phosphate GlcNAc-1-phosphate transferase